MSSSDQKPVKHECDSIVDLKIHEGEKPFKSESYDQDCGQKSDLQHDIHSVHDGKKLLRCKYCNHVFLLENNLQLHVDSVHEEKELFKHES